MLVHDIQIIEKKTYPCTYIGQNGEETVTIKFCIRELPNDMKTIAFLSGELSNSAKYFSSFANVATDNVNDPHGTFGTGESDKWHRWEYSARLKVVTHVDKFKKDLSKLKLTDATKRSKIKFNAFISQKQDSRQEFVPPIGKLVDRIHVEPLHLKNNACALAHGYLLQEVLSVSQLPDLVKCFSEIQINSPFVKYVSVMKSKCHLSRLGNKIVKWFNETQAKKMFENVTGSLGKIPECFFIISCFSLIWLNLLQNLELKRILLHMCLLFFV